jgi:hypothetical protein
MNMGSIEVSWNCKKQTTIANSSPEEEYISTWEETCEIVWLSRILQDFGETQESPTTLLIDSKSTINMAKNLVDTERWVNQYQVQFKTFLNLYLNHSTISNEQ